MELYYSKYMVLLEQCVSSNLAYSMPRLVRCQLYENTGIQLASRVAAAKLYVKSSRGNDI